MPGRDRCRPRRLRQHRTQDPTLAAGSFASARVISDRLLRVLRAPLPAPRSGERAGVRLRIRSNSNVRPLIPGATFDNHFPGLWLHADGGHAYQQFRSVGHRHAMLDYLVGHRRIIAADLDLVLVAEVVPQDKRRSAALPLGALLGGQERHYKRLLTPPDVRRRRETHPTILTWETGAQQGSVTARGFAENAQDPEQAGTEPISGQPGTFSRYGVCGCERGRHLPAGRPRAGPGGNPPALAALVRKPRRAGARSRRRPAACRCRVGCSPSPRR